MHPDLLLPTDPALASTARGIYDGTASLPLVVPYGRVDPGLLAQDHPYIDPVDLLIAHDVDLLRLLGSLDVSFEDLGVRRADWTRADVDPRDIWGLLAERWVQLAGTPSRQWLELQLEEFFDIDEPLGPDNADEVYDVVASQLGQDELRPRAMFERLGIQVLATTDPATSSLAYHESIRDSGWEGRVIPTFTADDIVDVERRDWRAGVARLGALTDEDTGSFHGYLDAIRKRRQHFRAAGAVATAHTSRSAETITLPESRAASIYREGLTGSLMPEDADAFRAHMLVEMAAMSAEDGLAMQLLPGVFVNHSARVHTGYGPGRGFDMPAGTSLVRGLKALLDRFGHARFRLVLFALDEAALGRDLASLAGSYPSVVVGSPAAFADGPAAIRRFLELTFESCGYANTTGVGTDAPALASIGVRHDVARRVTASFLAECVASRQISIEDASEIAAALAYRLSLHHYGLEASDQADAERV